MNNTDMRPRRRSRLVVMPLALVIVLAGLWSAFWFYAASTAETQIARWREREASFGRVQTCASQSVAGYPFRIEVRCNDAGLDLRAAQTAVLRGLKDFSPKSLASRLRELQAAGGRLDVTKAQIKLGDTVAVATGQLGLSPRGRLDGTLRVTVAGLEQFIAGQGGLQAFMP